MGTIWGQVDLTADSRPQTAPLNDQHRKALLESSAAYATATLAFANAIVIAQRAGETDEEIARVTGNTVPMIRAVLGQADSAGVFAL